MDIVVYLKYRVFVRCTVPPASRKPLLIGLTSDV